MSHVLIVQISNSISSVPPTPILLVVVVIVMPSGSNRRLGGICLASGQVISADELHKHFTQYIYRSKTPFTRLLVLGACRASPPPHLGSIPTWPSPPPSLEDLYQMSRTVEDFAKVALVIGIPCLLAPKWNISTQECIPLMMRFYSYMAENKVG